MLVTIANMIAMILAIKGSSDFVRGNFERGSWLFMIGNVTNMAVGLAVGNLWLFMAQAGLMFFTLNLVQENIRLRYSLLSIYAVILVLLLGVGREVAFSYYNIIDVIATVTAIYGAYAMSKQQWVLMAWMWIIADLGFLWVAYEASLPGLAIQSAIFVYHGYLRVTNQPIKALL